MTSSGFPVSSRALGLSEHFYEHLLHFFHSNAVKTDRLAELWFAIVIKHFPVYKIGCRPVLVLDGIKKSKEGRKMPAVKYLHQQSESNSKPHFIMKPFLSGLRRALSGWRILLLRSRSVHAFTKVSVTSNRDRRTLIDKANEMLASVCRGQEFVLLADAYYANGKVIRSTKGRSACAGHEGSTHDNRLSACGSATQTQTRTTEKVWRCGEAPECLWNGRLQFRSQSRIWGEKHLCPVQVGGSVVEARRGDGPLHSRRSSHERADHPLVYRPHHGSSGDHLASTVCVSRSKSLSSKRCIRSAHSDTISGWPLCDRSSVAMVTNTSTGLPRNIADRCRERCTHIMCLCRPA